MSDYRDVIKAAIKRGFFLDSCGQEERQYNFGLFNDLCGMSVEDAMSGCGEVTPKKKSNTLTFAMQKSSEEEYELIISAEYAPTDSVTISFTIDDEPQILVMPSGTQTLRTGILKTSKYANIPTSSIALSSSDETYTYKASNEVKTGIFILTINNNGSKTVKSVMYGEKVELPAVVEKEGYDFVWKDSDGKKITESEITMPEKDYTITGTYNVKKYTLSYTVYEEFMEDGTKSTKVYKSGTKTIAFGSKVIEAVKSEVPSRTGYTLGGWYDDAASAVSSATTMPSRNYEIFVDYGLKEYTIKYVSDGVTIYNEKKYYTDTFPRVDDPEKTGYNFAGWDKEIPEKVPAANYTLTAKFTAIKYYIYYLVDGVEKYKEQHIYGDNISIRANESKTGYTFSGWNPSELPTTMPAEDITVNGTFSINSYRLTCVVDGEEIINETYEYGSEIQHPANPEKEGYTFIKWNPLVPTTMPAHDVKCIAEFSINTYTLFYIVDGTEYDSQEYEYGMDITPIEKPEKEGYTYTDWDGVPSVMPSYDVEAYSNSTINSHDVIYMVDNIEYSSYTLEYNSEIELIDEPEQREGYTFSGWQNEYQYMPDHDVEINGYFNVNSHSVFYEVDGLVKDEYTEVHEYGDAIRIREDEPEKVGYTFSGWNPSELPATMPDNDIYVAGEYNINQYTMTFNIEGEYYSAITQDYDTIIPEIEEPEEREGYTFSGWDNPERMPAEDTEFDAYYAVNSYTATFKIEGRPDTASTIEYGADVIYPEIEVEEGYKLKWDHIYETMPANDIVVNGTIEEIVESTVVYYAGILNNEISGLTESDIVLLDSYDSSEFSEIEVSTVVSKSQELADLYEAQEKADDAGDDEEVERLEEEIDEWKTSHKIGFAFIIPKSIDSYSVISVNDLNKDITELLMKEKSLEIESTEYNIMKYYTGSVVPRSDEDVVFKFKITIG